MEAEVQRMLDLLDDLRGEANVNACFGEPLTVQGRTVIPVARVRYGFGVTAGRNPVSRTRHEADATDEEETGSGGIGGMTGCPLGVIEATPDGIHVESVVDKERITLVSLLVGAWSLFWVVRMVTLLLERRR